MKLAKTFVQDQDLIRCKGVYGNSVCTYLQESSKISRKETAKIFTKWVPKNTLLASYRRGLKCTLHRLVVISSQ